MNGYLLILIFALIVGAILFAGWALCRATSWHIPPHNYDEVDLWRRRKP